AVERRVEFAHHLLGLAAVGPDDDAVRPHAVRHGGAFLEKLGVGDHLEDQPGVGALGQQGFDRRADLAGRAHRYGGFVDDDAVAVHVLGDGSGDRQHILQVGGAILVGGRANGDELDTAVAHTGRRVGGELQPAGGVVVAHQVFQARFIDRNLALLQARDLVRVHIHADHLVADFGQHGALHQTHIARANYGYFHGDS